MHNEGNCSKTESKSTGSGNKIMAKAKDKKHVYMQQLPLLYGWLIIGTHLLSFSTLMVHASSSKQQQHTVQPAAAIQISTTVTPELYNTTDMIVNVAMAATGEGLLTATGNDAGDVRTKVPEVDDDGAVGVGGNHIVSAGVVGNVQLLPRAVDVSNKTFANNHMNDVAMKKLSINSTNAIDLLNLTDTLNQQQQNLMVTATIEMDLHKGKGYPTATSIAATSPMNFNHTALEAATFHEDCLANRNSLAHVFTVALYSVVCIVGLFGNTLVIWVVFRFSKMQTVTNIYILNLAIADECFLIGIPFLLYTMRICSWKFGEFVCKAYMVSTSITQFTSSIFLLIMAADRYIAVCHPIESPKYRTLRIAKLVSMIAWITSAILMMPVILFASTVRQEDGINYSCNIDWPEVYKKHSGATFILYTFLLGFATPLCFILVFYYLVIRKLHRVQQKHKSKEKKRSHRKVTRLVLTVITVYILCWLPHWISQVSLINSFVGHRELTRVEILLFLLFGCLAYSNSAMNPILYAFLSENFRKSFGKAFSCVAGQEMEAQLINEHSVFTHKRSGSALNKRKGSRRLSVPRATQVMQNNSFLAATVVHNSGAGSSSGTSASTATTATDKSSNSNNKQNKDINGVICTTTKDGEKITLVVNHESCGDSHKQEGTETQTDV